MNTALAISPLALLLASAVSGCEQTARSAAQPAAEYTGVQTRLLDGDLVNFQVSMRNPQGPDALDAYAQCAAAQYALIRGYGFARHLRTTMSEKDGIQRADAVYTISPSLPRGLKTIDAEVTVAACDENKIPTV